jgi:O-antigen ligase
MKKNIEMAVKILIYATFFVPLVVVPSSFIFPFIVPKILLFRSLVALMLGGYLILLIINWKEYRPKFSIVNLVLAAFFASFVISTFTGVDPYHSFWDNHERMLGLFTIFHYVAFYFVCSSVFKTWRDWQTAMRIFLIAGSVVMFIGVLQVGSPDLLLNQGSDRVASTLGNSIYVGGYGLFLSFMAILLIIREKTPYWRWLEIIMGVFALLGMFFSGTRGSMLGFAAGVGVALIGYMAVLKEYPRVRKIIGASLIFLMVLICILYLNRKTDFVKNLPTIGRTFNTSLSDVQASPRWIAWEIAIQSWKDRPLFGWGPNNYFYAFNQHYNPKSLEFGYGETWFDNAHNIIVNTLAVQGTVGIVIYLAMFFLTSASLWVSYKKQRLNFHVVIIGTAFLVAHLIGNITVFENPTSYLYFMFWLAMINGMTTLPHLNPLLLKERKIDDANNKLRENIKPDKKVGYGGMSLIGLFFVFVIFLFNIQPSRANTMTLNVIRTLSSNPVLAVTDMKNTLAFGSPHIDDIRSDISRTVSQVISSSYQQLGKDRSNEILEIAYSAMKENLILHPLDIRNQLTISQLAGILATVNNNYSYLIEAENYLKDALSKSPKRQQVIYTLANTEIQINKPVEAEKLLRQAIDYNPKIAESYWRLAYMLNISGNNKKAKEIIDLAKKNGIVFSDKEQEIVNQIFVTSTK